MPPPADAVSSFLPAFWEGVGIIVIGSVGAWGPGAGRYPFALCVVAGFYGTYFKGVFGTCAYPAGEIIAGSIYGNSGSGTIWRCYQVTVFIQLYLEIFGRRNIAPGCSTFRGSAPFYTAWCSRIAHISIFIKYKADVQDDGSAAVCFSCAYIFYLVITGFNRACKGKLKVAGTGTGEGIFIFIFQTNADLSFRWIGLAPVISFVISNFHGVDVEIFCVVTGRSYFYFAAAASGTDVRVNGQIDLSHFCFACSKGAGCHAGRNKKGGKKNGSYFF